jgi:hypothetical protein
LIALCFLQVLFYIAGRAMYISGRGIYIAGRAMYISRIEIQNASISNKKNLNGQKRIRQY